MKYVSENDSSLLFFFLIKFLFSIENVLEKLNDVFERQNHLRYFGRVRALLVSYFYGEDMDGETFRGAIYYRYCYLVLYINKATVREDHDNKIY